MSWRERERETLSHTHTDRARKKEREREREFWTIDSVLQNPVILRDAVETLLTLVTRRNEVEFEFDADVDGRQEDDGAFRMVGDLSAFVLNNFRRK